MTEKNMQLFMQAVADRLERALTAANLSGGVRVVETENRLTVRVNTRDIPKARYQEFLNIMNSVHDQLYVDMQSGVDIFPTVH